MNASKEKLTGQIDQLEQTKVLLEESVSKLETDNEDLRKALEQARNELNAAKTTIDQRDETIQQNKVTIDDLEQKLKAALDLHEDYENTIEAMTNKISKMSDIIDDKNGEINTRNQKVTDLEEREELSNKTKKKLKQKVAELEVKNKTINQLNKTLTVEKIEVEQKLEKSKERIVGVEGSHLIRLQKLTQVLAGRRLGPGGKYRTFDDALGGIDDLTQELADAKNEMALLKEQLAAREVDGKIISFDELLSKLRMYQKNCDDLEKQTLVKNKELSDAENRCLQNEEVIQSLKQIRDQLRQELDEALAEITQLGADIAALELDKLNLTGAMTRHASESDSLNDKMADMKVELDQMRAQLSDFEALMEIADDNSDSLPRMKEIYKFVSDLVLSKKEKDARTFVSKHCQTEEGGIMSFGGEVGFEHEGYNFQYEDQKVIISMKVCHTQGYG